ncbi:NADH-quinone oxidoreductase subunit M [soil metagenome]
MTLLLLMLLPLIAGIVVALLPAGRDLLAKQIALGVSLVVLVGTLLLAVGFDADGDRFQQVLSYTWVEDFGVRFSLGVDGIAVVLIALIGVLVPLVIAASWNDESTGGRTGPAGEREHTAGAHRSAAGGGRSMKAFFAWLLVLETTMIGVFAATDIFLFYVFFEVMLVPMYFLIGSFGGPRRHYAAVKFFLYSLLGGLIMLASVIGLFVVSNSQLGQGTFAFDALRQLDIDPTTQRWLFLGFFIAFAIKAPLVPFHTWLPDAGAEAPIGGAVLLVGVLDKVGTFGFLRYCLPLFPDASRFFAPFVLTLSVLGIFYGALLAMGQSDMKRLLAYTSIAHFGFIGLGIFAFTSQAGVGAVLYMVNHGISTGALFIVVGILINRRGSRLVSDYGGLATVTPLLGGVFLIAGLSSLALPGTNSFVSEFLVLIGAYTTQPVFTILAAIGIILAALYILLMYQRTMHGPVNPVLATTRDLDRRELAVLGPLVALILVLGVYPKPIIDIITPAVDATMVDLGTSDPGASVADEGGN